jgi:CHASE2 domain-containing sensor protein/tRNA A-37 threonylcarbamoyl transferase component Bud32
MADEPTSSLNEQYVSAAKQSASKVNKTSSTIAKRQTARLARLGHLLTGACGLLAAMAVGANVPLTNLWEIQARTLFFELRGRVDPPKDVVILAIDEPSLTQPSQYYQTDKNKFAHLEPLQAWPWKRVAYAKVIEKLMGAGARAVALDILFDIPSSYGPQDDRELRKALQKYPGRVVLAAKYSDVTTREGTLTQLLQPERSLWTEPMSMGTINFPLELDNKIHRFPSEYQKLLADKYQANSTQKEALKLDMPSFPEAVLQAANVNPPQSQAEHIYFYGPAGTFDTVPFWHVLDSENWNSYLQNGKYFQDKIVIIGGTAQSLQDLHGAPFSKSSLYPEPMPGVEIHANAIATLMQGFAIRQAIPNTALRGLFVLLMVGGTVVVMARLKRGLHRFVGAIAIAATWGGISYIIFVSSQLIFPTAVPIVVLVLGGFSYLVTGEARQTLLLRQIGEIFKKHPSSEVVRDLSQHGDFQDLIQQRQLEISGKILDGRYKIVKVLGSGGFSETYIAEDTRLPGNPPCVVKQLRPATSKPKQLEVARRLFQREAKTLQKLGYYSQIPQLLAYFEEDEEFYLVQELIVGHPLSQEFPSGKTHPETTVIQMMQDILQTLAFIHRQHVIHRDIKPSNIIRRHSDGKLVLIDFGAVKEVTTQLMDSEGQTGFTIGIGTQGYAPNEQCAGRPHYSSDIYAVGMIAIKALTGKAPHELDLDADGEVKWVEYARVTYALADIISKMVLYDYKARYQSASEVVAELQKLLNPEDLNSFFPGEADTSTYPMENLEASTTPWEDPSESSPSAPSPPSCNQS